MLFPKNLHEYQNLSYKTLNNNNTQKNITLSPLLFTIINSAISYKSYRTIQKLMGLINDQKKLGYNDSSYRHSVKTADFGKFYLQQ